MSLLVALAASLLLAPAAVGNHVQCGAVLTENTTLDSDLVNCPGDGVVIGAGGITVDLDGHTIDGVGADAGGSGVNNAAGYDGVTVRDGAIAEFGTGVRLLDAEGNRVRDLRITDTAGAAFLQRSDANVIERNTLRGNGLLLYLGSDRNVIRRNSISTGAGTAIILLGNIREDEIRETRIEDNRLVGNNTGAYIEGAALSLIRRNVVAHNTEIGIIESGGFDFLEQNSIHHNRIGVHISGARMQVSSNRVTHNALDGIVVPNIGVNDDALLEGNVTSHNGDDGIDVDNPTATITRNTANRNADLGIEAVPGNDGGGNRAKGNGNPAQCVNVACSP